MISQVLTFSSDVNVGLQVGDIIYYSPTIAASTNFNTISNINTIITFGIVTQVLNNGVPAVIVGGVVVTPAIPEHSIVVMYDNNNTSTPVPAINDYIMFSKNKEVNSSSLKGYFAEIKLMNYSTEKIELFSVGSEVSESSK